MSSRWLSLPKLIRLKNLFQDCSLSERGDYTAQKDHVQNNCPIGPSFLQHVHPSLGYRSFEEEKLLHSTCLVAIFRSFAKYLSYRTVLFATGLPLGKICKIVVLLDCPFCNPQDHDHLKNQCCNRFLHPQDSNHLKKMLLHWTVLFAISDHLQN